MTLKLFFLAIVVSYDQDITGLVPSIIFLYNNNNNDDVRYAVKMYFGKMPSCIEEYTE